MSCSYSHESLRQMEHGRGGEKTLCFLSKHVLFFSYKRSEECLVVIFMMFQIFPISPHVIFRASSVCGDVLDE